MNHPIDPKRRNDAKCSITHIAVYHRGHTLKTKLLMQLSALFLLILGGICTFAPQEAATRTGVSPTHALTLLIQAAGSLYLGFAILNWTAKDNLIGGIYSRPVALGNFLHFASMAIALLKTLAAGDRRPVLLLVTLAYAIFATWFGLVTFGSPVRKDTVLP